VPRVLGAGKVGWKTVGRFVLLASSFRLLFAFLLHLQKSIFNLHTISTSEDILTSNVNTK